MNGSIIQILILAGIALFLIFRLRDVLGTRDGFEPELKVSNKNDDPVDVEAAQIFTDENIADYNIDPESAEAKVLLSLKKIDPEFQIGDFLEGAKAAYEMILMAFEEGRLNDIDGLVDDDIMQSFADVVAQREDRGLKVEAKFIGLNSIKIVTANFDEQAKRAEISVHFAVTLISVVRDENNNIVEGNPKDAKNQTDIWTFAREIGSTDVNWVLIATSLD